MIVFSLFDMYYAILCISVALILYPVAFNVRKTEKACIIALLLVFMFLNVCNRKEPTVTLSLSRENYEEKENYEENEKDEEKGAEKEKDAEKDIEKEKEKYDTMQDD